MVYMPTTIIQMQEHSSNSEQSNFFALSSESSRHTPSPHHTPHSHQHRRPHYSAFIRKVKYLLQADNDDLDELYRKVEIIVRRYFHEHKIVEFSDMYDHITSLKTNSSKMATIVALLQRKLITQQQPKPPTASAGNSGSRSAKQEQTQTNSKQLLPALNGKQQLAQQKLKHLRESYSMVTSSHNVQNVQNEGQVASPAFHKSDAITTNISQQSKSSTKGKKKDHSPASYSPDRLNSSFEDYQTRNKQYEEKVKQLLTELKDIKQSLDEHKSRPSPQPSPSSHELRLNLAENSQYSAHDKQEKQYLVQFREEKQEIRSETSIIDSCLEKNLMNETNQTSLTTNSLPKEMAAKDKLQSIKEKSNESISSKTIGSAKSTKKLEPLPLLAQNPSADKLEQHSSANKLQPYPSANKLEQQPSVKKLEQQPSVYKVEQQASAHKLQQPSVHKLEDQPSLSSVDQRLSVQQKKLLLLQQAENITKQLHQLKLFASQLQLEPKGQPHPYPKAQHQQTYPKGEQSYPKVQEHTYPKGEQTYPKGQYEQRYPKGEQQTYLNGGSQHQKYLAGYQHNVEFQRPRSELSQTSQLSQNIFVTIQRNNNQILEKIAPTISKPMIESLIPSFKYVREDQPNHFRGANNPRLPEKMIDSSSFSFSQNRTHPPIVQMRPIARSNHLLLNNQQYSQSIPSAHNIHPQAANGSRMFPNLPQAQQVQTIKYIYNPYANPTVNSSYINSVHFTQDHNNRSVSQIAKNTPSLAHNNSQTSIMRRTAAQPQQANKSRKITFDTGKYSHLRPSQPSQPPSRSLSNIQQSQVKPMMNYSGLEKRIENNSSMLRKKGINMLSPHPRPFLHR